jgi:hypothetical protein
VIRRVIKERFDVDLDEVSIGRTLKELGFAHVRILKNFPERVAEAIAGKGVAAGAPVEVWFQDEMRVGQKNGLVYQWAKKGTRPRQPKDQRYANAYLFGAIPGARHRHRARVSARQCRRHAASPGGDQPVAAVAVGTAYALHLRLIIQDDPQMTAARLALVQTVVTGLASGLGLLGVEAPEEMR